MCNLRDRSISSLSGGQQQRVFLARALAKQADLLIFDEPFTGVDCKTENIMFEIFAELKSEAKTLLVISHDLSETLEHYDRLILLNKRLIAIGSRQEVAILIGINLSAHILPDQSGRNALLLQESIDGIVAPFSTVLCKVSQAIVDLLAWIEPPLYLLTTPYVKREWSVSSQLPWLQNMKLSPKISSPSQN